jgi:hypothetical protein
MRTSATPCRSAGSPTPRARSRGIPSVCTSLGLRASAVPARAPSSPAAAAHGCGRRLSHRSVRS